MAKKINIIKIAMFSILIYFLVETSIGSFYLVNTYISYKEKQKELSELKAENDKLKDLVNEANTDDFIEKYARENLGLARPNETVIYFKPNNENTQSSQNHDNFIKSLLKLFKK
jgi:cell division protein FtsB